ncbi:bacterial transferase hexapeptide family protein, partial [Vibrio parahaemolyticus V-223/04]
ISAIP